MTWWRDFWDGLARSFGYAEWVWGSAADWVAAIGTVGAFGFGFLLLRREIRERRSEHANALRTEPTFLNNPLSGKWSLVVDVENSGPSTVTGVSVYQKAVGGPDMIAFFGKYDNFRWKMAPGATQRRTIELDHAPAELKLFVEFRDVSGRQWRRSLDDQTYISRRRYNRLYWGTWGGEPNKAKIRQQAGKVAFQQPKDERDGDDPSEVLEDPTPRQPVPNNGHTRRSTVEDAEDAGNDAQADTRQETETLEPAIDDGETAKPVSAPIRTVTAEPSDGLRAANRVTEHDGES